jgi:hypothetical protein
MGQLCWQFHQEGLIQEHNPSLPTDVKGENTDAEVVNTLNTHIRIIWLLFASARLLSIIRNEVISVLNYYLNLCVRLDDAIIIIICKLK